MKFDEYYAEVKRRAPEATLGVIREAYQRQYDREPVFEKAPARETFRSKVGAAYPDLSDDEIDDKYDEIYDPGLWSEAKSSLLRGMGGIAGNIGAGLQALQEEVPTEFRGAPGIGIAKSIADMLPSGQMIRDYWQDQQARVPRSGVSQGDVFEDPLRTLSNPNWWAAGVPEVLASQAATIGGFALGGVPGAAIGGGYLEGASTYGTAKDKGLENPLARGLGMGLATGALNAIPFTKPFLGMGGGLLGRAAVQGLAEGVTEGAEEIPGTYLESEAAKWDDYATFEEGLRRAANVAPLAAVTGGANALVTGGPQEAPNQDLLDVTKDLMGQQAPQRPTTPDNPEPPLPQWAQDLADKGEKPYLPQPGIKKTVLPKAEEKRVAVEATLAPIYSKWQGGPKINVVSTFRNLPEDLQKRFDDSINGAYDGIGSVYLIADKYDSPADAARVLFHESLGHYSIEQIVPDIDTFASDVSRLAPNDPVLSKYWEQVNNDPGYAKEEPMIRSLETVAKYAEEFPNTRHPLVERMYSRIREFGRKLGLSMQMSRADLNLALRKALRNLERGTSQPTARTADGEMKAQRVWHGSPHDHEGFDNEKIGTGEGVQAYGYGHYFAGKKDVAEYYRKMLSSVEKYFIDGKEPAKGAQQTAAQMLGLWGPERRARIEIELKADRGMKKDRREAVLAEVDRLIASGAKVERRRGRLYEVEIPDDGDYLLWEKPLSEQPAKVQPLIDKILNDPRRKQAGFSEERINAFGEEMTGGDLYNAASATWFYGPGGARGASQFFKENGVPGVKYPAGAISGTNKGDYNYVVFEGRDAKIVSKASRPKPLDMSTGARMQRARDQEFDTTKRFYHGTAVSGGRMFDSFDPSKRGLSTRASSATKAEWFTDSPTIASEFSRVAERTASLYRNEKDASRATVPVYLGLRNPFVIDEGSLGKFTVDDILREAKAAGHDGVIFKNSTDNPVQPWIEVDGEKIEELDMNSEFGGVTLPAYMEGQVSREQVQQELDQAVEDAKQELEYFTEGSEDSIFDNRKSLESYLRMWERLRDQWAEDPSKVTLNRATSEVAAVFDPTRVRSVNAAFDPRDASSPRLLASRPGHTVKIRRGDETLRKWGIEPGKTYLTRQVAMALEARQRESHGTIAPDDRSREAARKIARWMTEEVLFEMEHPDDSGVGWYGEKFQAAVDAIAEYFPELRRNANDQQMMREARQTLTALIAITSDGQKVQGNFDQAVEIYSQWRASGEFVGERGHSRGSSIVRNLERLQDLYERLGIEGTHRYLMEESTVQELRAQAREDGQTLNTAYEGHITLPRAALIFGPKLGAFYANLSGSHGYLTMDRWWSRTFNRMRGSLIPRVSGLADKATDSKGRPIGLARFKQMIDQPGMSDEDALLAIIPYRESYEAKNFKNGTDVERAANTLYKQAYENIEDAPFNAGDRTFMLSAVGMAQDMLARRGHDLSVADIQAILWYYEKRLYRDLGTRETPDVSYLEAARAAIEKARGDRPGGSDLQAGLGSDLQPEAGSRGQGPKASRPPYPAVVRTFDDRVRQSIVRAAEFSPEVRDLYLAIAQGQKDRIETQRRGVQSWSQTEKQAAELLASALGFEHVGSLVAAAPGRAFNPEDFSIMKGAILEATEMVEQGVAAVREDRSPANLAMLKAAMDRLAYLQSPYMGGVAEAGRSLNYLRKLAPVTRNVNQLLDAYVRNPDDLIKVADEITEAKDQEAQTNPLAPVQREIVQVEAEKEQVQQELDAAKVEIDRMRQQGQDLQEVLSRVREMERQVSEMEKRQAELEAKAREIRKTQPEKPNKPRTVAQIVREEYTPTLGDKFKELFYSFILSGPATQGANLLGNSLYAAVDEMSTQAGLRATGRGAEANARLKAMTLGIHTGIRNAKEAWKTEMPVLDSQTKLEAPGQDFHPKAIPGPVGRFIRSFGGRALQAEDEFFKGLAYTLELAQLAVREANGDMKAAEQLMADPTQEMQEAAVLAARRRTFTSRLGSQGQAIVNLKNKVTGAWLIIPFIQTPINLVKRAMDYSPLGLAALPFDTEMRADMRGENGPAKQAVAITRQVVGAGLALMVWEMAASGLISGGGPPDEKEKTLRRQRDGWQPYSVKIGDTWYSYSRFDPLAIPLGVMADLYETHGMVGEKEGTDIAISVGNSFVQNLANKTWLTGVSELAEMINEPERYGKNYISGFLSAWVPNIVGQTTAANDPWLRESRTILDRIRSRIPGEREELAQKIGISGQPIPNDAATLAGVPMPWRASPSRPVDPVADAMLRLGVMKDRPSRKFRGVELTPEEYGDWVKMLQQQRWRVLTPIVQSPQFNALPPLMQANQLEKVWDRLGSNDYNQAVFLMQHPELLDRIRKARKRA